MRKLLLILAFFPSAFYTLYGQIALPANMYADSVHAPFYYGVSSGDPTSNSIILWSCVVPNASDSSVNITWQLASDMRFEHIIQSGNSITDSSKNFTLKIDVVGLSAASTYYYRFVDADGRVSIWGRTKTLPIGSVTQTKVAVLSCSSIYSGYFNAYRRLAERNDLQVILHLGDFIYDYVDVDEQVRVPIPYPTEPITKADWVERYKYYYLDPDLREARRMQTWSCIWDNHDLNNLDSIPMQAFIEWLPIRETPEVRQHLIYRNFSIGDLVDINMLDANSRQEVDTFLDGEANMLDNTQFEWLSNNLKTSTKKWHLIGSQKMAGGWYTHGIDPALLSLVPNDSNVFDKSSWDGFMETRNHLFDTIETHHINNCMIVSGDAHITMAMDLVKDPYDSIHYNPISGLGAVGTEFLPTSISRGNFDEGGLAPESSPFIIDLSMKANPHHLLTEINSHGYGLLEINQDSIVATPYYSDILHQVNDETAGQKMVMINGENHWKRALNDASNIASPEPIMFYIQPNPAQDVIFVQFNKLIEKPLLARLFDMQGREILSTYLKGSQFIQIASLTDGTYYLTISDDALPIANQKLVVMH